jgi:hypothetical protein
MATRMSSVVDTFVGLSILVVVVLLISRLRDASAEVDRLTIAADSVSRVASIEEMKRKVMESIMSGVAIDTDRLLSDKPLQERAARGGVLLYWMSASCAACRANYGVLEALAKSYPGRVVAISPNPIDQVKGDYDLMNVDLIQVPESAYHGLFPKEAFPVSLVVHSPDPTARS